MQARAEFTGPMHLAAAGPCTPATRTTGEHKGAPEEGEVVRLRLRRAPPLGQVARGDLGAAPRATLCASKAGQGILWSALLRLDGRAGQGRAESQAWKCRCKELGTRAQQPGRALPTCSYFCTAS